MKAKGMAGEGNDICVIAQGVEAVFPELVSTWGDEEFKEDTSR